MSFFDYHLPEHLIAQHPAARRDESRLLVVHRGEGSLDHRVFRELSELLASGDLLVLNDTKVLPARLIGIREETGGRWEALFLGERGEWWEMLAHTRGHPSSGTVFVTDSGLRFTLRGRTDDHHWLMEAEEKGTPGEILARHGHIPLPPYIRKGRDTEEDSERYQTVYADRAGSVAAPTAGLHFTPELLDRLATRGIGMARVTLHVGLGTFAPIKVADPANHRIHREWCEVTQQTVDAIRQTKARGGRVVAVGTTTTRTLESAALSGELKSLSAETDLYIHPPFAFKVIDAMITNFHLPRTTLLHMVSAFTGGELLEQAYAEAIAREYRFYSYGDAMLVL
jgi:S-adenosylmethionine:tRNA ribosyltransferase-isomerase